MGPLTSLLVVALAASLAASTAVSPTVCYTGFLMDVYCIERGTLLDVPSAATLTNPEQHSIHCLIGVDVCINNAGLSTSESLLAGTVQGWRSMLDVNVLGTENGVQISSDND